MSIFRNMYSDQFLYNSLLHYNLIQNAGENLEDYLQRLKALAKDCEFKEVNAATHQDEAIRDALIAGLYSVDIRQRLLEESDLTLNQAFEKACALYTAQKNSEAYQSPSSSTYTAAISDAMTEHCTLNDDTSIGKQHSSAAFQKDDNKCYYWR